MLMEAIRRSIEEHATIRGGTDAETQTAATTSTTSCSPPVASPVVAAHQDAVRGEDRRTGHHLSSDSATNMASIMDGAGEESKGKWREGLCVDM